MHLALNHNVFQPIHIKNNKSEKDPIFVLFIDEPPNGLR